MKQEAIVKKPAAKQELNPVKNHMRTAENPSLIEPSEETPVLAVSLTATWCEILKQARQSHTQITATQRLWDSKCVLFWDIKIVVICYIITEN